MLIHLILCDILHAIIGVIIFLFVLNENPPELLEKCSVP